MDVKTVDPALQLDVDAMILDYLIHSALVTTLEEAAAGKSAGNGRRSWEAVARVNGELLFDLTTLSHVQRLMRTDFLTIFNAHHKEPVELPDTEYRMHLLQFLSLYTYRGTTHTGLPTKGQLRQLRTQQYANALKYCRGEEDRNEWGTLPSSQHAAIPLGPLRLLDLIPLFFRVSSFWAVSKPQQAWMHLAAEMLLQAVLEVLSSLEPASLTQGIVTAAVMTCFSYGCHADTDDDGMRLLFWDHDGSGESIEWLEIRDEYRQNFSVQPPITTAALGNLQCRFPLVDFEARMHNYLEALTRAPELPVLVQLAEKRMLGLSEEETLNIKQRCGLLPSG